MYGWKKKDDPLPDELITGRTSTANELSKYCTVNHRGTIKARQLMNYLGLRMMSRRGNSWRGFGEGEVGVAEARGKRRELGGGRGDDLAWVCEQQQHRGRRGFEFWTGLDIDRATMPSNQARN